jgi:Protein of unknown function (DUF2867)
MRLPNAAHEAHVWRISEITEDFALLDVWALPARGGRDDFDAFLEVMSSIDPTGSPSAAARALFRLRFALGALFGWDEQARKRPIPDCEETSLHARLPGDLRGTATAMKRPAGRFVPIYRTKDEWAAEISNETVHAIMHLAWVEDGEGSHRPQMAVYVRPRGTLGELYMALIGPFRHWIVYPALMRQIRHAWDARGSAA